MHPNPAFRQTPVEDNIAFARERAFGILSVNDDNGPLLSHVPFLMSDDAKSARLHLVRSNPIARLGSDPVKAVIAISGPDSYISPDWYEVQDQVPTWNYVAVHLRGTLHQRPPEELKSLLDDLSQEFETRISHKSPWTSDKMSEGVMDKMMRQLVPFRFEIGQIEGTWKLGQNKPGDARPNAAKQAAAYGIGQEPRLLAALMLGAESSS
ncbi:FMN-binding negative transcriptional regulator [Cochlodiniinecator piscidefendens]|uniref:FMN-binding negative transcriptional regulator n=1 Tax=Cochlodiniinecator piscidefendens TaxID=2715756 RepID=UPI00140C9E95|nr:FMN-binding negative transcriptional regulator [Cochlodiniinecator piscidefendens]